MKWEFKLYFWFGLLIVILFILQAGIFRTDSRSSEVNALKSFSQLMLDMECNVFLLEGESQHILVEGPGDRMKNIETTVEEGSITVKENGKRLISRILNIFEPDHERVNIYITINNLDNIKLDAGDDQPDVKYVSEDMIGLTLKNGNILILETKGSKKCA